MQFEWWNWRDFFVTLAIGAPIVAFLVGRSFLRFKRRWDEPWKYQ